MKKVLHPIIREIIRIYDLLDGEAKKMPKPKPLTQQELEVGLDVSFKGSSVPEDVPMTPFMNEVYKRTGEKLNDEWRLKRNSGITKAEKWVSNNIELLLRQFNGPEELSYNESLPIDSVEHYNVSCYRNFKKGVEMRDIRGEQLEDRKKVSLEYKKSADNLDVRSLLLNDPEFQKAVLLVLSELPEYKANNDWKLTSLPFMNKNSNVTYPFFKNDRAIDPKTGLTYGQMAIELAKRVVGAQIYDYNYATLFGRNQKGKGRVISAVSRVPNVIFNQIESEDIEACKRKSPLFVGYGNDNDLKQAMIKAHKDCEKFGLKARNVDQIRYDMHISRGLILLEGAMSYYKANGERSKTLVVRRTAMMTRTYLINGLTNSVYEANGRIFSGEIDTNLGGGKINAVITTYGLLKQDQRYSAIAYQLYYRMWVMGDDNMFLYRQLDYDKFSKAMADLKFEVNDTKDEFGLFFLQWRLFKNSDGNLVMSYPWTRVIRSLLYKEQSKGLGPYGWVLAAWQQISKCRDYKPALSILVNFIAYLDEMKLCLNISVKELLKHVQEEDEAAVSKLKTQNARSKFVSTLDKLSDGDPQKQDWLEPSFLDSLQQEMREVYDPDFFNSHHLIPLPPR